MTDAEGFRSKGDGHNMVKGLSKRVVVIQSPESDLFEQAIFIVRDHVNSGVTSDQILKEAYQIAGQYTRAKHSRPSRHRFRYAPLFAAAGAAVTGLIWLAVGLIR